MLFDMESRVFSKYFVRGCSSKPDVDKLDIDKLKNVSTNLSNLKSNVDKLDVPVDLSKLRDVVKNDVVKKDVYNAKIKNTEDKIHDITHLTTKTTRSAKINKVRGEVCNITNLATATSLTVVENKIPNVSNIVKKTITHKLVKMKRKILIIIMKNILLPQILIILQQKFFI